MASSSTQLPEDPQALSQPQAPSPKVRVRVPPAPAVRVRRASIFEQLADSLRNTVLSEETLVLLEFVIIVTIGVIAFITIFPTMSTTVDSVANYLNKQFSTNF
jgi:hypothetical protein